MRLTGTDSRSIYLDGAGATLRYPAAVFGTRDAELVAQHPKQRHLGNYVDLVFDPIDRELDHVGIFSRFRLAPIASFCRSSRPPRGHSGRSIPNDEVPTIRHFAS